MSNYITRPFVVRLAVLVTLVTMARSATAQYTSDEKYGLRIGAVISDIPQHYLNPYRTDVEFQGDLRVDTSWYAAVDAGWNRTHLNNPGVYEYKANGYFLRIGADYNLLKPTYPQEANIIYGGFRYGIARMRRSIPQYQVVGPYWGNVNGSFAPKTLLPMWGELILGLKVEVLNNFFMGWSLHTRILITQHVDKDVRPYLIPGFGKATGNAVFDFNYTVSYRIPMFRPRVKPPRVKKSDEKKDETGEKGKETSEGKATPAKRKKK